MAWYMRACPACGGDLHDSDDRGWVECLMCARSFRVQLKAQPHPPLNLVIPVAVDARGRQDAELARHAA